MSQKRLIEIFSAGCAICEETIQLVNNLACPSCDIQILDMAEPSVIKRAQVLGIGSLPAVLVDGKLADCCSNRGSNEAKLRATGIGQPV